MRPLKIIVVLSAALALLSFSISIACDGRTETAEEKCVEAVNQVAEATIPAMDTEGDDTSRVSHSFTVIKASIRAGTNLTQALYRVAGQVALAIARTAYATVNALS